MIYASSLSRLASELLVRCDLSPEHGILHSFNIVAQSLRYCDRVAENPPDQMADRWYSVSILYVLYSHPIYNESQPISLLQATSR